MLFPAWSPNEFDVKPIGQIPAVLFGEYGRKPYELPRPRPANQGKKGLDVHATKFVTEDLNFVCNDASVAKVTWDASGA